MSDNKVVVKAQCSPLTEDHAAIERMSWAVRKSVCGAFLNEMNFRNSFFFFFAFLGPYPRHMEVPRLGLKSEL